jgi:PadR family transcriptional regulator PadR
MKTGRARNSVSQLRKGTLEYCVLALLRDGPRYGFELVRTLPQADGLLSRLRRDHLVSTSWQESETGAPRRYYQPPRQTLRMRRHPAGWLSRRVAAQRKGPHLLPALARQLTGPTSRAGADLFPRSLPESDNAASSSGRVPVPKQNGRPAAASSAAGPPGR